MKNLLALPILALAAASATTVSAQSGPNLQFSGVVMLESFATEGRTPTYAGFADISLDYGLPPLASGVQFGVTLNYLHLESEFGMFENLQGGVYLESGNQRVTLGAPESSFNTYRGRIARRNSGMLRLMRLDHLTGPLSSYYRFFTPMEATGVRYDGQFGAFDLSASYEMGDFSSSQFVFTGLSARYTFSDAIAVWASAEEMNISSGYTNTRYAAGLTGQAEGFEYSLTYIGSDGGDLIDANVFYDVNENFEVGLGVAVGLGLSTLRSSTLTARYTLSDRYFVSATLENTESSSSTVLIGVLNVGIKF